MSGNPSTKSVQSRTEGPRVWTSPAGAGNLGTILRVPQSKPVVYACLHIQFMGWYSIVWLDILWVDGPATATVYFGLGGATNDQQGTEESHSFGVDGPRISKSMAKCKRVSEWVQTLLGNLKQNWIVKTEQWPDMLILELLCLGSTIGFSKKNLMHH